MWDKILFFDSLSDYPFARYVDHVLHILCTRGTMSCAFQEVRYNIVPGDYVILPNPSLASDFSESGDFEAVIMCLSEPFVTSMSIRSNYGIIGHMSLLQNPVMKLSARRLSRVQLKNLCVRLPPTAVMKAALWFRR